MFTGLVETTGRILRLEPKAGSLLLFVDASGLSDFDCKSGDSVAVNGCCLTVAAESEFSRRGLWFAVSDETLAKTNLGRLEVGCSVNLERAARIGDRIGGHLVSGHVDSTAEVVSLDTPTDFAKLEIWVPKELSRYCISKGSACLDGVSLTINEISDEKEGSQLSFTLVPTTLNHTNLGTLAPGDLVNFEADMIGKHLARQRDFQT